MNTLVVEDDGAIRGLIVLLAELGLPGAKVSEAACAVDALAAARSSRPDVIVLDLGLPDMNGLDLLARLRQDGFEGEVVIATAEDSEFNRNRAARLGASAFLVKPFDARQMQKALRGAAGHAESRFSVVA